LTTVALAPSSTLPPQQQLPPQAPKTLEPFHLERFFARFEFDAPYLLCCSDCEALALPEVLSWADPQTKARFDGLSLGYTESRGCPLLRREVSALYETVPGDGPLSPVVAAPQECVLLAMLALLRPGAVVVAMKPAYQSLYAVAEWVGCTVLAWEPDGDGGDRFSLDALRRTVASSPKGVSLIVVNFPHNPTGFVPTALELGGLVEIARSLDCYLFSDEMYTLFFLFFVARGFGVMSLAFFLLPASSLGSCLCLLRPGRYRGLEYSPAYALPSLVDCGYSKALALGGLSKAFAAPGLRIGWLVSHDQALLDRVRFEQLYIYNTRSMNYQ